MNKRTGFTLVELMVVVLIVGILAAVAIPIMRGQIDSAKWTEGKAMAGTIASSLRAYAAEKAETGTYGADAPLLTAMGLLGSDFNGTYFAEGDFSWTTFYTPGTNILTFTVTVNKPASGSISSPDGYTLNNSGVWGEVTGGP